MIESHQIQERFQDPLTLAGLLKAAWCGKWLIIAATFCAGLGSIYAALQMPNMYTSEAILAPKEEKGISGVSGQLGGLASLAGIDIGGGNGNKTDIALEVLKSRKFLSDFVNRHEIAPALVAANGWLHESDRLTFDEEIYNPLSDQFVRTVEFPYTQEPSDWELYERFKNIMSLSRDPSNGMITVGIEFYSPYLAQQWTSKLVEDLNLEMRQRDREQAKRSIEYLQNELANESIDNIRDLFFGLIEEQLKTKMLAEVTPEYAFTVVNPPQVTLLKSAPKRSLIVIVVTFLAGFISTLLVVMYNTSGRAARTKG
ncbi:Wzz/FepE/Etk N-terminal domain-containing protein [Lacimicrobium sp. SS2-24]|uniref:Wzz/FepE/Etk N-terminal domain-containing protein n=1 Tax=Lacimicrobium sp. SS2-24 TaxID=2005569 RepID=UPI000B4C08BF|nr:Wzz/FepE/Etk N-terminal domain-containing protein [Lacimicrobium sp. SS2-24]